MIRGSQTNRRYGLSIIHSGEYMKIITPEGSVLLNGDSRVPAIGISRTVNIPEVKVGEPLDFVIRISKTAGVIRQLPKEDIYINKTFVEKTNFNTFGGGSKGNKVIISSGSTGGTNRAILIENFGSVINTGAYDVSVPIFEGIGLVDNSIYTFESNERISGYQLNGGRWVTVSPNFQIDNILLKERNNLLTVRDMSGNITTFALYCLV